MKELVIQGLSKNTLGKILNIYLEDVDNGTKYEFTKNELINHIKNTNIQLANAVINKQNNIEAFYCRFKEIEIIPEYPLIMFSSLKVVEVNYEQINNLWGIPYMGEKIVNEVKLKNTSYINYKTFTNLGCKIEHYDKNDIKQNSVNILNGKGEYNGYDIITLSKVEIYHLHGCNDSFSQFFNNNGILINRELSVVYEDREVTGITLIESNIIAEKLNQWVLKAKMLGIYNDYRLHIPTQTLYEYRGTSKNPLIPPVRKINYGALQTQDNSGIEIETLNIPDTVNNIGANKLPGLKQINLGKNTFFIESDLFRESSLDELYTYNLNCILLINKVKHLKFNVKTDNYGITNEDTIETVEIIEGT